MAKYRVRGQESLDTEWWVEADNEIEAEDKVRNGGWSDRNVVDREVQWIDDVVQIQPVETA